MGAGSYAEADGAEHWDPLKAAQKLPTHPRRRRKAA